MQAFVPNDMTGSQIMRIDIMGRGYSSITLQGSQLKAGMYMYSLIVDGRMILNECPNG
jgi:hypothetical protein